MVVESTSPFVYTACVAYLDVLSPSSATIQVLRAREPDFQIFCVARDEGHVCFHGCVIDYHVHASKPVASDSKPEPHRQLVLTTRGERSLLLEFVRSALEQHRLRTMAPRGQHGAGVMRYRWDVDAECWDSGRLVAHRPLDTLFLPDHVAEDAIHDLTGYLKQETQDAYASLHIAPIRVYMAYGPPGTGKTSFVHCLASETGHNLATLQCKAGMTDDDIARSLRDLPPKTFVCIEDIDTWFERRTSKNHGVTFASVLAALDGAYERVGGGALTVFLTTNTLDQLDQALRRRVDYAVEFGFATRRQCHQMFAAFHPGHVGFDALWARIRNTKFSMSVFQKFLVQTLHGKDPLACSDVFDSLVQCMNAGARDSVPEMYV